MAKKKKIKKEKLNALSGSLQKEYEGLKALEAESLNSVKALLEFKEACKRLRKIVDELEKDDRLKDFFEKAFKKRDGDYVMAKALPLWDGFIEFEVETLEQFGVKDALVRGLIDDVLGDIGPLNPPETQKFVHFKTFKDLLSDFSSRCCMFEESFEKATSIYDARRLTASGTAAVILGLTNFRSSRITGQRIYSDTAAQVSALRLMDQPVVLRDKPKKDEPSG